MSDIHPITSRKKAQVIATSLFLIGLVSLVFTQYWWPGIMLIVGVPLALRQYLAGRNFDSLTTLLVFVGTFITVEFDIEWQTFLPTIFTLAGIFIIFREFFGPDETTEEEVEEELNHEIEEEQK